MAGSDPSRLAPTAGAFEQGLRDLGYIEGKNILVEYRYAEGNLDRVSGFVAELVQDAFFSISDAIVNNNGQTIVDAAKQIKLPTMWDFQGNVTKGGLASYSVSFHEMGRVSAKYVQRILAGAKRKDMPVQAADKIDLVINLEAAKQIGLTIPPNVLARADRVIR